MKLFDTHAHCDDARFENEYLGGTDKLILDSFEAGVEYICQSVCTQKYFIISLKLYIKIISHK